MKIQITGTDGKITAEYAESEGVAVSIESRQGPNVSVTLSMKQWQQLVDSVEWMREQEKK